MAIKCDKCGKEVFSPNELAGENLGRLPDFNKFGYVCPKCGLTGCFDCCMGDAPGKFVCPDCSTQMKRM
jgi:predicted RNA-binding Zn-ribbon protein involved in translation (DUF1610 family)